MSEKYAELAKDSDSYNAGAFVNLANCSFEKGDIEKAKELYMVALENDASCVEALYNLGLCNKRLRFYEDALECFFKLQSIVRNHAQVTCLSFSCQRINFFLAFGIKLKLFDPDMQSVAFVY